MYTKYIYFIIYRPFGSKDPKTWIDLMFVDVNDEILHSKNITPRFRSHHNLIDVEFSLFIPKPPENNFTYRNFIKINPEDINGFLANCKWETFLSSDSDLDSLMNFLNTNLQLAIDELAPLKTVKPKRHKQPWIDEELKFLISKQKATEKRYLRT